MISDIVKKWLLKALNDIKVIENEFSLADDKIFEKLEITEEDLIII